MSHTKGPWKLQAGRCFATQSGEFYLSYGSDPKTGAPNFESPTELDANARLIAAAPELLEALESLAEDYYRKIGSGSKALAKADAAIAKARGQ